MNYYIFHKTSNSIDNALMSTEIRTHTIFNQSKIKEQVFQPVTDAKPINYNRVFCYPYKMEIIWNDGTTSSYLVYVGGANGKAFNHVPNPVNNLLEERHPAKVVVFKGSAKQIENAKNVFRDQNIKLRTYDVFYDDVFVMNEAYYPLTKSSNIADFGHKY